MEAANDFITHYYILSKIVDSIEFYNKLKCKDNYPGLKFKQILKKLKRVVYIKLINLKPIQTGKNMEI